MNCINYETRKRCEPYCEDCPIKLMRAHGKDIESIARALHWNVHFVANVITPNELKAGLGLYKTVT